MTGLLLKDIFYMREPKKYGLILIPIIFTLLNSQNIYTVGLVFGVMGSTVFCDSLYEDEISHWNNYGVSLPITRNQIIACKYLLILGGNLIFALWASVIMLIRGWLNTSAILTIYSFFFVNLLLSCITLMLTYAIGSVHTKIIQCLVYFPIIPITLICAATGMLKKSIVFPPLFLPVSLIVLVVGVVLSFFLSCVIFKNKEL